MVFSVESRPGGVERNHFDRRPKTGLEVLGKGLGQQCHVKVFAGPAQKWRCDGKVAHAPKFYDQQLGLHDERDAGPADICSGLF